MATPQTLRRPAAPGPGEPAPSRAALRKQRLLEMENEQRLEDAEALKFTDEQRLSLFLSFRSVKFEWSDLDGMLSVRRYNTPTHSLLAPTAHAPQYPPALPLPPHEQAFAVLTNAHLASFGKDETICVRRSGYTSQTQASFPSTHVSVPFSSPRTTTAPPPGIPERYCSTPTPYDAAPRYSEYAEYVEAPRTPAPPAAAASPVSAPSPARRSPKPSRSSPRGKRRSPVKGLFPVSCAATSMSSASAASSPVTVVSPIKVPLPPFTAALEDAEDDEDAWVDEDDEAETTFIASTPEEEDGLITPVPSSVWRFPAEPPALRVDVSALGLAPPPYEDGYWSESEPNTPVPFDREATPTPFGHEREQVGEKRKR